MRTLLSAVCVFAAAAPAAAAIETATFRGYGVVTASRVGPDPGLPQPVPPAIGTPVAIGGSLFFGDAAPIDGFTGVFVFDEFEVFNGTQGFSWGVAGGGSGANTVPRDFAYPSGATPLLRRLPTV